MKMRSLELCPVHKCEPWMASPFLQEGTSPELAALAAGCKSEDFMHAEKAIYKMFPDVWFSFCHDWTVFCPECAKKNPFPGKHNKFGYGFSSQYSLSAAKGNWNKACKRFAKRSIKELLKGKEQ